MPATYVRISAKAVTAFVKTGYLDESDIDDDLAIGAAMGRLLEDMGKSRVPPVFNRGKPKKTPAEAIATFIDHWADEILKTNS